MRYNTSKTIMLAFIVLFMVIQQLCYAQDASPSLKGRVTDQFGNPMYGVEVNSGNGKNGTSTDKNGEYSLSISDGSGAIAFKYTGCLIVTKNIGEDKTINAQLQPDVHKLDEEIQLGYNSQRRGVFTGAAAVVTGAELERAPVANFGQTLAGRLAGLTTLETYSELSRSTTSMAVRGFSFARNTGPLVVVDGVLVPYNSDQTLAYISPAEIESITVLKDASSQALYGILGGNGLLVVKTKRGRKGALEIRTRLDQSVQQVTTKPAYYDAATYAELKNLAAKNDYVYDPDNPFEAPYSDEAIAAYKSGADPLLYPDNNWYKRFMKDLARMERVSVNLTGGSDNIQYYSNINVMHQGGYFKTDQTRYNPDANNLWVNYRSNVDMNINKWIKAYVRLSGNIKRERTPGGASNQNVYSSIFLIPSNVYGPVTPKITDKTTGEIIDEGGEVVSTATVHSPTYGLLNRTGYARYTVTNTTSQFGVNLDLGFITKGLSLTGTFNYQTNSVGSLYTTQDFERYTRDKNIDDSLVFIQDGSELNTALAYSKSSSFYYHLTYNALLNYQRSFRKHNIQAFGYMFYQDLTKTEVTAPYSFPYKRVHTGAELIYNYSEKYLLKLDFGYSGSDQYARNARYTFTPSAGAGWVISKEPFLQDNKVLTLLKVRASYGKTANDQSGLNRFAYEDDVRLTTGGTIGSLQYLVVENTKGNPGISAEVSAKANGGIDIGLFNAITITADVFKERVNNMVVSATGTIPSYQGIPLSNYPSLNQGKYENKGFEISVDYSKEFNSDWGASLGGNLSYAKNTIINVNESERTSDYAYSKQEEGFSYGQEFGYLVDRSNGNGMFNTETELNNNTLDYSFGAPRLGDLIYKDLNGDGTIDERDKAPIGYGAIPRYAYGINGRLRYKSFELNILFQGIGQFSSIYSGTGVYEISYDGVFGALHSKSWTAERYAAGEQILYPALSAKQSVNHQPSDFFSYNRSFVRLKNVELSYTFSGKAANAISAQSIRLLLSGQNLITWDKMKSKDFGPEGSGYLGFPVYRVYNFGLSVTF
ncbi:SusC/RagA family TonB-linked outer membrane protein [Parafilimonas sp.]|uniref:SusC/RagA family TonB-linked outer membrane protein n=1 Tax=Parafilimonas sp. TaxID=1969739 RepID=UPI0039E63E23